MKKLLKSLSAAAAAIICSLLLVVTVYAEDYEFDVSSAIESSGSWGQSYIQYTPLTGDSAHAANFNPTYLTEDSEIIIEYTYTGDVAFRAPIELIWQTWDGGLGGTDPDVKGTWNKIAPYEYDDTTAKFAYKDICDAYGTSNFGTVYAVCVGDTGVKLTVTKMTATNYNAPEEVEETEAPAEETTVKETTKKETEATTTEKVTEPEETTQLITSAPSVADNAPKDSNTGLIILIVVIIVVVVAVIVVFVIMMIKKTKGRYY